MRPLTISSGDRIENFFSLAFGVALPDLAMRMEGYCLSGLEGLLYSSIFDELNYI